VSSFPLSVTSLALFWLFVTATGVAYGKFRQDADTTERQALSGALGVGVGLVVLALLIFVVLGIPQ
jgi:hypothetical protein